MRIPPSALPLLFAAFAARLPAADLAERELAQRFDGTIRPLLNTYCVDCHSGKKPKGDLDFERFTDLGRVVEEYSEWSLALEKLEGREMPSEKAKKFPTDEERQQLMAWIRDVRVAEAHKNAGDPGIVLARRLSNAEYNYTIRDLTGVDLQPAREFPVDPANPMGFDNSGESLAMSPTLLNKYLQAARDVANHLVLEPEGIAFAPHPMLVETDRDKYCVNQIIEFYHRQATDYADYFRAAWRFKHRAALGRSNATLADIAAEANVSAKYLATVWKMLDETAEDVGPGARLQAMWRALPAPTDRAAEQSEAARAGCAKMRDWVIAFRAKLEPRFPNITGVRGIAATSQPFLMWKNRQYATHRRTFDPDALQIDGRAQPVKIALQKSKTSVAAADAVEEDAVVETTPTRSSDDPDLSVPATDRARYEAAFARFCAVFPDAFYVQERGRNYLDKTKDKGRLLSAGFHNVMGYFRDDLPLYELVLDEKAQRELDALWQQFEFVAAATARTYVQFYFNESSEARDPAKRAEERDVTKEPMVKAMLATYLSRVKDSRNPAAVQAIEQHFETVNATLRWAEKAHAEAEPRHLRALLDFATRAYRRPLTEAEQTDLTAYYQSARKDAGLSHEDAMRELVVAVLMSPDFCYRLDLTDAATRRQLTTAADSPVQPLSDYALASRLSYFLWASAPDEALLARAAAGELHRPEIIAAEARRMLRDPRARSLATEFGGNWLDFRRFEELNTVDRERFPAFTNELRAAMFEEPVRFMVDVFSHDRPVLDFLYAKYTFVNATLARHYGMPEPHSDEWVRIDDADHYGRGGLLPMAAFLTKNAPGLRTSPVKRGYWVVKKVLGEYIPPPPAVVPELPRDEAKTDLPLRDVLARHRSDKSCAACHARFDALGLVFEGYGPVGERRTQDLAGRAIDAHATFPGGFEGDGLQGLRTYVRDRRQNDFVDNLCRKLLAYSLGRSLLLSDDPIVEKLRVDLAANDYRFDVLVAGIVTSPQFLNHRLRETVTMAAQ
jgi:hypothetical protein